MIEFKDSIIKLNDILKKNDLSLANEFECEYTKLVSNFCDVQFFLDMNGGLVNRAYRLILIAYGADANLSHFTILMNNYNNKGKKMIDKVYNLDVEDEAIEKEIKEISFWFLNDYYSGLYNNMGGTKTYEHCYISRFLSNFIAHQALHCL